VKRVQGADTDEDRLLTTAEVAEILGVTPRTVQRKAHTGQIPIVKVMPGGRHGEYVFRESDIEHLTETPDDDHPTAVSGPE
jgi:excisionase family DNA binding protein